MQTCNWQSMTSAPKDGRRVLLHFPGEADEIRLAMWTDRTISDHNQVIQRETGWRMCDRAEVRGEDEPAAWCPIAEPPPPPEEERAA